VHVCLTLVSCACDGYKLSLMRWCRHCHELCVWLMTRTVERERECVSEGERTGTAPNSTFWWVVRTIRGRWIEHIVSMHTRARTLGMVGQWVGGGLAWWCNRSWPAKWTMGRGTRE
jgi:hypothetical protein